MVTNQDNELPQGFKMTELGPLSEEWETTKLGDLFDIKQGKALSPEHRRGISPRPFLRTANVFWGYLDLANVDSMDFTDAEVSQLKLILNDLLVCEGGDIGRTAIWRGDSDICCYQNHLHRLRTTRTDVYPLFYMYWMQAAYLLLGLYGGTGNKTTIPNLSQSRLKSFVLPLPPLPEQRAIAHVLSIIQSAIEAQDKIIAAAREMKKSLMHHLFTYGPVPVAEAEQVPLKETEIGPVPENWDIKRISEVCQVKGSTVSLPELIGKDTKDIHHAIVHGIKVSDMTLPGNEREITKANIEARLPENLAKKVSIPPNSVIFPKRGAAIATNKKRLTTTWTALDPNIIAVVPTEEVDCYYLLYWFLTIDISKLQSPGPTPQLNRKDVDPVLMPLPPQREQQETVRILSTVDNKIESEEKRKVSLQTLFQTMLHLLMTGKLRVKGLEVSTS